MIESPILLAAIAIVCSSLAGFLIWVGVNFMRPLVHASVDDHQDVVITCLKTFAAIVTAICFLLFAVLACSMIFYRKVCGQNDVSNKKIVPSRSLSADNEDPPLE